MEKNPQTPSEEKPRKKKKWKRVVLIVFLALLLLIVIAVAAVGLYVDYLLNQLTPYDPSNDMMVASKEADDIEMNDPQIVTIPPDASEDIPDISDITFTTEPTEEPKPEEPVYIQSNPDHVVNILLIGQDRKPGEGRQRSDSMILLTFNKSKKTLTLTSFMRDQYVQIPGYKPNKLNAAYAFGGMSLLNETLRVNFNGHVDGNVEVDFAGFTNLIDMLGGVDISLTSAEVKYMNHATDWNLTTGVNRLTGEQALVYSRIRAIDSDYRRAERQRKVILSLLERYKNQSLPEMLDMLSDVLPMVTTNMDKSEIVNYAVELAPMLTSMEMDTLRIPVDGSFRQGNVKVREGLANWFQYDIDFQRNRQVLRELLEE